MNVYKNVLFTKKKNDMLIDIHIIIEIAKKNF